MIPITTTAPRTGIYPVVIALIVACVGVFLFQGLLTPLGQVRFIGEYALIPLRYANARWALMHGLDPDDYLPFLTMAFLHGGWLHLLFNMWTLWLFGRAVEARLGSFRFTVLYVICALLASGAHMLAYPGSHVPTLGASGAIAGVLGAHAMLYPRSQIVLVIPIVFIPLFFRITALAYVAVWFGLQVFQGAGSLLLGGGEVAGIAWWAHIGGFLAGIVFVAILAPPAPPAAELPRGRWQDPDARRSAFEERRRPVWPDR
jgi:membrane associated rhomboid family serine protease